MFAPVHASDPPAGGDHGARSLLRQAKAELRQRGYARETRRGYLGHIRRFLARADLRAGKPPDPGTAQAHLRWMAEVRGYSASHVSQCACALKFLYRYVCPRVADADDLEALGPPRADPRPPAVLRPAQVTALLNRAERPVYRAILVLTYAAGLRVSEVVRLRPGDLDLDRGVLRVPAGASTEEREVMLSEIALAAVRASRTHRISRRWLFPGRRAGEPVGTSTVHSAFRRARAAAGLEPSVGIQTLRHSFAVHLLERGVALELVQELLGHARRESTRVYVPVASRPTAAALRSPVDDLEGLEP